MRRTVTEVLSLLSRQMRKGKYAYPVVVLLQELRHHRLMLCERLLQICVRVAGNAESRSLDVVREHVESVRQ